MIDVDAVYKRIVPKLIQATDRNKLGWHDRIFEKLGKVHTVVLEDLELRVTVPIQAGGDSVYFESEEMDIIIQQHMSIEVVDQLNISIGNYYTRKVAAQLLELETKLDAPEELEEMLESSDSSWHIE